MDIVEALMRALPGAKPFIFAIIIAAFNFIFFAWLDKHARYRPKRAIAVWVFRDYRRHSKAFISSLERHIKELYSTVYGNPLSIRGFIRSCVVSTIIVSLLTVVWIADSLIDPYDQIKSGYINYPTWSIVQFWAVCAIVYSVTCDYASVLLARLAVRKFSLTKVWTFFLTLLGCLAATIAIYLVVFVILDLIFQFDSLERHKEIVQLPGGEPFPHYGLLTTHSGFMLPAYYRTVLWGALTFQDFLWWIPGQELAFKVEGNFGPFIYSSLFALFWFVLFLFSASTLKVMSVFRTGTLLWTKIFDVRKYPLMYVGVVGSFIILVLGGVYQIIFHIIATA
jgi:hypothetical protein